MNPIAHISTPYPAKFGVPRQAGLVPVAARIVFEPEFRVAEAIRGLEDFEYVWLIWQFHMLTTDEHTPTTFKPTVRPPRLGGNRRIGVFATRSPFRPNPIGLSCVRLLRVEPSTPEGPVLHVEGSDLVDGTPILDIKPYLPYTDAHPEAHAGFAATPPEPTLQVTDSKGLLRQLPKADREALVQTIAHDPRPHYHHNNQRRYTMPFAGCEVTFVVDGAHAEVVKMIKKNTQH